MRGERGEESSSEQSVASRGRQHTEDPAAGAAGEASDGVLTLICLKCGNEYYASEDGPPAGLTCEKCGSTVFREFFSAAEDDEASRDFRETTERDLDSDDPEGDTLPGDLIDLERGP
jgi:predicted nucleic-acid-binding Zn-ribbon protein